MINSKMKNVMAVLAVLISVCFVSCDDDSDDFSSVEILTSPTDLLVQVGDTNDENCLWVDAVDSEGKELAYEWRKLRSKNDSMGIMISGATSSIYIPNKSKADTSWYYVTVMNASIHSSCEAVEVIVVDSLAVIE